MKKYEVPAWELRLLSADVLMASDENETDSDYVNGENLVVDDIHNI